MSAPTRIARLADRPEIRACLTAFDTDIAAILDLVQMVQQIPAPTFAEASRAAFVAAQFADLGLADVQRDDVNNVFARLPGAQGEMPVVVSAHLDTVFAADTDLSLRFEGARLYGPGVADNAAGVAGLLTLARYFQAHRVRPAGDIWFVANSCEEGLGNLRGMRAVVNRFGRRAHYVVVEGGLYGQVLNQAVAVSRYRLDVTTEGGHAWKHFGRPSAIHVLGNLITAIDRLAVPRIPWTTYNIGLIDGGTSINTIASSASLWLDLRSTDLSTLQQLNESVAALAREVHRPPAVAVALTEIGHRPAGKIAATAPLVRLAEAALNYVGCEQVVFSIGSSDANIPLSLGLSALCVGLASWGNVHRTDEYLDTANLPRGLQQLALLVLAAAEMDANQI